VFRRQYFVYIAASKSRALYTGMTSNIFIPMWQHKAKNLEPYQYVWDAIEREKEIKRWLRTKKIS
jgi:putative endonuclease